MSILDLKLSKRQVFWKIKDENIAEKYRMENLEEVQLSSLKKRQTAFSSMPCFGLNSVQFLELDWPGQSLQYLLPT